MITNIYSTLAKGLALCTMGLFIGSCSDWTEVESVKVRELSTSQDNPELYAEYLQNLKAYRQSEHKAVYVWFDNSSKNNYTRAQHITDLPDSVDVVSLTSPDNLAEWELQDIESVRSQKGIKVIFTIDYDVYKAEYKAMQEVADAEGTEPEHADFVGYLTSSLEKSLQIANKYPYDGICVRYMGKSRQHMTTREIREYTANETVFLKIIADWASRNGDKLLAFEGNPQNVMDKSLLGRCEHILLSGQKLASQDLFTFTLQMARVDQVPEAKLGMVVSATDFADPNKIVGYLSDGRLAMQGLVAWAPKTHQGLQVSAVGVYNVQTDYYTQPNSYQNLRDIIASVNPTLK